MLIIPWMIALKKTSNVIIQDKIEYRYIERVDTFEKTKLVPKYITKTTTQKDTLKINDTTKVEVEIPIETKIYEEAFNNDSCNINFKAQISGYKASFDSLWVDVRLKQKETLITQKIIKEPSRLQFGIISGVGYGFTTKKPDIFVGVGLTYRF